jgi:WD40 repeat protein
MRGNRLITVMPRGSNSGGADIVIRSLEHGDPRRLGFLPDGPRRIQVDASGERYVISYPGDRQLFASTLKAGADGQRRILSTAAAISSFWLAKSGERIALLDDAGSLHLASLGESREPRQLPGPSTRPGETVNDVAFDSTGRWLVAAVERQGLRMWSLIGPPDAEPMVLGRGKATTATTGAVFEPTGRWLAAEDLRGVTFWPVTRRWPSVLRVAADQPRDVAFDPNGRWIAAASRKGGVEIWPLTADGPPHRLLVEGVGVTTLAVSPDGRFLATGTRSGSVLILTIAGSGSRELRGFRGIVYSVSFDRTGKRIAANGHVAEGRNEIIRVFDLDTGDVKDFDPGDGKDIASVAFLADGGLLSSSFGGLRRIDLTTGSSQLLLAQPGVAFLGPDGRHVLLLRTENANFPEGTASVYDLVEQRGWPLTTHGNQVTLMNWDPSGSRVVTGSRDGTVRVGPVTGEEPHLLIGHDAPVWGVRVDSTGRLVASTSEDGTVRIWPMPDGRPLHTWPRDELLEKLRSQTNVRIVEDASTSTGYRTTFLPFQGWDRDPPAW